MINKLRHKSNVIILHFKKMGYYNAANYILQRVFKRKSLLKAKIKNTNLIILLRNNRYDIAVFTQIFLREELNVNLKEAPGTIIDGGANIGLASLYLKNKYPRAKIIAVEPEEANFELLCKNTMPFKDIICINKALWNRECVLQLLDNGNGNASFVTREVTITDKEVNRIDTVTIAGIIEEYGIEQLDLLKLDIEGSEKNIFEKNYEEWLSKTRDIIVEIHPHLNPDCESTVMNALNIGFTKSTVGEYYHFSRNNSA